MKEKVIVSFPLPLQPGPAQTVLYLEKVMQLRVILAFLLTPVKLDNLFTAFASVYSHPMNGRGGIDHLQNQHVSDHFYFLHYNRTVHTGLEGAAFELLK